MSDERLIERIRGAWPLLLLCFALPRETIAQRPVQSIIGTVREVGDSGAPLVGADVLLGKRQTTTDARGGFRVDSLIPGEYSITIRRIGYRPVHSRLAVVASEPTRVEYFMAPAPVLLPTLVAVAQRTGIYGVVADSAFHPLPGAKVAVLGFMGSEALTDSLGRFSFPKAHGGFYMIQVTQPGYGNRRASVEVAKGKGRELSFRLVPASQQQKLPGEAEALWDLRGRLAWNFRTSRMTRSEMNRFGTMRLCDVPKLIVRAGDPTTVILNGVTVLREASLCAWRMDEIELVEFCDVAGCPNPDAPRPLLYPGLGSARRRWAVVIWEKR